MTPARCDAAAVTEAKGDGAGRETCGLLLAVGVLVLGVLALGAQRLDEPGLYYDEVIQATPASEFLRADGEPLSIPGARNTWLFGGWFPLMTQPYMGALKSQLLIPTFAVFGSSRETLRIATLVWACLGLLLLTLWVRELHGRWVALTMAALLACDPSFLFVARHDWGSVSLALFCRGGGLWLATLGWRRGSTACLGAGGLLLGLGVYNKVDFAVFLAGCALGVLLAAPRLVLAARRARPRQLVGLGVGLLLGSAPMWTTVDGLLLATKGLVHSAASGDLAAKRVAWRTLFDGSYFHRLMLVDGDFARLGQANEAASGPFAWIFGAAFLFLVVRAVLSLRRGQGDRPALFVLVATTATFLLLLATPRAAAIHHVMNVLPLPQLVVALAAVRLASRGAARRALALTAIALALLGGLRVDLSVFETLRETGGSGRWSGALEQLARELPADTVVVSLDWGLHAPLRFVRPELDLREPIWRMHGGRARLRGGPRHLYLVTEPALEHFRFGSRLLAALEELPPGAAIVRTHRDRRGEPAFRSVSIRRPHELIFGREVEVRIR